MQHRRPGKVFSLRIVPPGSDSLFPAGGEDFYNPSVHIRTAIKPGNRASRYGREWIVGQTEELDGILAGRIGFQGEPGTAEIWDDDTKDFLHTAVPNGLTAPFAIDLKTLVAVMQPRGSLIKVNSLISAFEALLNQASGRWRLEPVRERMSLSEWKASVERVTAVKFLIREPNPHYHDAKNLQELMEQMESEVIELEAKSPAGLNLAAPFIVETEGHLDRGYGEGEYRGETSEGSTSYYATRVGAEEQADLMDVDQVSGEVPPDSLRGLLADSGGRENRPHERELERREEPETGRGDASS
jgi:hypothetical protein